jgi:hypothetical protein
MKTDMTALHRLRLLSVRGRMGICMLGNPTNVGLAGVEG